MLENLRSKRVTVLGKSIPAMTIALLLIGGLASAALLTYYGTITATVNVQQSILLDSLAWPASQVTDIISEAAPGGETFCFEHYLTNQMSVAGTVNFEGSCSGMDKNQNYLNCDGITKTYYNSFGIKSFDLTGDVHGTVTKEDLSESIKWTITITDTSGHYGVGLVIGDANKPSYQVWFREYEQPYGWYYQTYTNDGWCGWGGSVVALPTEGITATGDQTGQVFTITIPKSKLGGIGSSFHWAVQARTTLIGKYPAGWDWCDYINQGNINNWAWESTIGNLLTPPVTLQSGETKDFYICYSFAQNIWPGTYTITTGIVPA